MQMSAASRSSFCAHPGSLMGRGTCEPTVWGFGADKGDQQSVVGEIQLRRHVGFGKLDRQSTLSVSSARPGRKVILTASLHDWLKPRMEVGWD
jgi:hypothetical protein